MKSSTGKFLFTAEVPKGSLPTVQVVNQTTKESSVVAVLRENVAQGVFVESYYGTIIPWNENSDLVSVWSKKKPNDLAVTK
jgi:hypothetical protein